MTKLMEEALHPLDIYYVKPSWQIHFHFIKAEKNHMANMYGFKSRDEAFNIARTIRGVDRIYIKKMYKRRKFGPWIEEQEEIAPKEES